MGGWIASTCGSSSCCVLATFGLRTFRLAEPYEMHFDEVYHARTATEFLQAWRYGESHDIYEWTHPHLAKYAMAAGLVLWGEDHVSGTGDLGTPVVAAAIEHRREDPITGERAGERVHLATGDVVRSEDLRTRRTVSVVAAPGVVGAGRRRTGRPARHRLRRRQRSRRSTCRSLASTGWTAASSRSRSRPWTTR